MNRRIFICTRENFPRGGAGANYVQYLALALKEKDWSVVVIGKGVNRQKDFDAVKQAYEYRGIEYFNLDISEPNFISRNFLWGKHFEEAIKRYGFNKDDYAIFFSLNISMIHCVKKYLLADHLSVCRVEWFVPSQYRLNIFSPSYIITKFTFKYVNKNIKKVFPISTMLDEYSRQQLCKTLLLPSMADPFEYEYSPSEFSTEKIRFIYSGNKVTNIEDAVESMLKAFLSIDKSEWKRIELHITGLSRKRILDILHGDNKLLSELDEILIIHKWLDYDDLIKLYLKMNYLFLARKDNLITRANFPSKVPEILCYGVVPICTDIGDYTKEYLQDGVDCIMLNGCSVEECKRAILKTLNMNISKRKALRSNCRNSAIQKFYYKNWADKITNFIME